MNRLMKILFVGLVGMFLLPGCGNSGSASSDKNKKTIAVIPKGLTHDHWKKMEAGARKAAGEAGNIIIDWKGPPKEDDTDQQIKLVQNFVSSGVDGIVLAPLSDKALVSPVRLANSAGIPVLVADSGLDGEVGKDYISYVGTDNYNAGRLGGEYLAGLINDGDTVMLLRYMESSASTIKREQGFLDALKEKAPNVKLIDPPQYAGGDANSAKKASENMITAHQGEFQAVFCPNESSTKGMLLALEDRQLAGKVKFVGFDIIVPDFPEAMAEGKLHGFVVQNPFQMGYKSVQIMIDHFAGKKVPEKIDTGAVLVTPENIDKPEIRKLITPVPED
jgi:ribose transport system substrate-binding protein